MSGEFGRYTYSGYLSEALVQVAEDCAGGEERATHELTKAFGHVIGEMAVLAGHVAYLEAGDSGPDAAAKACRQQIADVLKALDSFANVCADAARGW